MITCFTWIKLTNVLTVKNLLNGESLSGSATEVTRLPSAHLINSSTLLDYKNLPPVTGAEGIFLS